MKSVLILILVLHTVSNLGAETTGQVSTARSLSSDKVPARVVVSDEKHKLGAGDRLNYRVVEDGNAAVSLLVTDSGEVDIPYLGRVLVAGKTCGQLRAEVKQKLEVNLYRKATVELGIEVLNKLRGKVYLVGKVKNPGAVDLPNDEDLTVSKAILKAGGFAEFANQRKVKVIHNSTGDVNSPGQIIDVAAIWQKGNRAQDIKLSPGDLIFVPAKLINF
jgi:protein involved in polysaccharide export with SLBB domain